MKKRKTLIFFGAHPDDETFGIGATLALYVLRGYRDSGMGGSEQNKHPDALAMAPIEEVAERMVKIIRELKPDVVLTHDAGGGYGHPDHIATHNATVKAFYAAGDPAQYPKAGPLYRLPEGNKD